MSSGRYAVYFAPARESAWWTFGAGWLGRDEIADQPLPQPCPAGFGAQDFAQLTAEPRRYGFHATLKAPFRLKSPEPAQLFERVDALAAQLRAVPLGSLVPLYMDGFVALAPARLNPAVVQLGARCVVELDDLRAPLTDDEVARRQPERLDERGRDLLARYGYPHVLERLRFHMTLSGPVDAATAGRLVAYVAHPVAQLHTRQRPSLDRLCVFHEREPGQNFVRVHEAELRP